VSPEEECEHSRAAYEWVLSDSFAIAYIKAILAILIANPCQFLFELLCILLAKIKVNESESMKEQMKLLSF